MDNRDRISRSVIGEVSSYISRSQEAEVPPEAIEKAKHHILDTLAAMVSGSKLRPGEMAKKYVENLAGAKESQVMGSPIITTAIDAALANGMMAHADETDDSHPKSRTHPGCSIIPAALAMSERVEADGMGFLKGALAGYDIGCRITQSLGVNDLRKASRSSHSIGNTFGAAAAAAAIARLAEDVIPYVLSYAAQQASGIASLFRDEEHIEKAFVFAGMPARNGVTAAMFVESGFTAVRDVFSGEDNFFSAFSPNPRPELLTEKLGSRYEMMFTNIKRFSVGSPIQAAWDALLLLMEKHKFSAKDVEQITARLPDYGAPIVNNRSMPDINLQHILAVTLVDGGLTFEMAHSYERMSDPAVLEVRKRARLVEDPELSAAKIMRQAIVEVTTKDGAKFMEHVVSVRGTVENPMTRAEVEKKSKELLAPVLGKDRSDELVDRIWNLDKVRNVRQLRPLLSA